MRSDLAYALEAHQPEVDRVRDDYSGRGMNGSHTHAVVTNNPNLVAELTDDDKEDLADDLEVDLEDLEDLLSDVRCDNLGLSYVLY